MPATLISPAIGGPLFTASNILDGLAKAANFLGLGTVDFADFKDPNVQVWPNVGFADNYYQTLANPGLKYQTDLPSVYQQMATTGKAEDKFTMTPNGRPILDADVNIRLDGRAMFHADATFFGIGLAAPHSRVQSWYSGSANLQLDKSKDLPFEPSYVWRTIADSRYQKGETSMGMPWYRSGERASLPAGYTLMSDESGEVSWDGIGTGWAWSIQGGGSVALWDAKTRNVDIRQINTEKGNLTEPVATVFNGDFQSSQHPVYGRFPIFVPTWTELPGWSFQGGSGGALQGFRLVPNFDDLSFKTIKDALLARFTPADVNQFLDGVRKVLEEMHYEAFKELAQQQLDVSKAGSIVDNLRQSFNAMATAWAISSSTMAKEMMSTILKIGKDITLKAAGSLTGDLVVEALHWLQSEAADFSLAVTPSQPLRHDWMYFEPQSTQLTFKYRISEWDPDAVLKLDFYDADGTRYGYDVASFNNQTGPSTGWATAVVDVPWLLRGKSGYFEVNVMNGPVDTTKVVRNGTGAFVTVPATPRVQVDNFRLVGQAGALTVEGEAPQQASQVDLAQVEAVLGAAKQMWIAAGADAAALDMIEVHVAELEGGAVASTRGAVITVDPSAAGFGWFVDATPEQDEEFGTGTGGRLLAAAGSGAEGKVDLLTALAHEIGHALGLQHADDAHDLMATMLQVGMRKDSAQAYSGHFASETGQAATGPVRATSHVRTAAATTGHGQAPEQNLTVPNPTLLGGSLQDGTGWSSSGAVSFTGGAATLGESATAQARLSQAFVVGALDRFLTFTVGGPGLQSNGAFVQDAFEVALVDAASGASLLGNVGLTRSDAVLNVQRNGHGQGVTRKAAAVHALAAADGATTYVLDLRDIAAGTVVNLSFDLIGFGPAASTVAISDVRLSGVPEAADDTATLAEDGSVTLDVRANDSGASLPGFAIEVVTQPLHGALTVHADGTFTYQPDANHAGADSFAYRLASADASSNVATVTLTVTPVNDAPTATAQAASVAEDGSLSIALTGADIDSPSLAWRITNAPQHGTVAIGADGTVVYTPSANFFGADTFSYVANDGELDSAPALVSIAVTPVNDAPVAADAAADLDEDGSRTVDLRAFGLDVDGTTLDPVIVAGPAHGTLVRNADGSYTYTPAANYNGVDAVRFALRDSEGMVGNEATLSFTIAAVNDAPMLANQATAGDEDRVITGNVLSSAQDVEGSALIATVVAGPMHGTVSLLPDGSFTYTPGTDYFGPDSFTYRVSDGELESGVATVAIDVLPVNDAPTLADSQLVAEEEAPLASTLVANAADIDSGTLSFSVVAGPAHGYLFLEPDGSFIYRGYGDYNGPDSFTYVVSDGEAQSRVATVSIEVTPVNDLPYALDTTVHTREDELLVIPLRSYGFDVEDSSLELILLRSPEHGSLWENADGTFSYQPDANFNGLDFVQFIVRDDEGAESNVCTVRIEVGAVNDGPALLDQAVTAVEDTAMTGNLLATASDIEGDALSAELVGGPLHGTVTFHPDGTFSYQGAANFNGVDSFSYRVNDGELASRVATVTITVGAVNDAPVATDAQVALDEDGMAAFDLRQWGTDVEGTPLTPRIVAGPLHGTLALNPDGSYSYAPEANYNGPDFIRYVLADGEGLEGNEATVAITVNPVNDTPTVGSQSLALAEDGIFVGNVMETAADVEGSALSATLVRGAAHGVVQLNANGSFSYRPDADYFGDDSFQVTVSDGELVSTVATFAITVAPVNDAPTLAPRGETLAEDGSLAGNLLATARDIDSAGLAASVVTGPSHGALVVNADGSFSYTPDADYFGSDSFTWQVSDGQLDSDVAVFTIAITPVNDAPVAADAQLATDEDTPLVFDLRDYAFDVDGTALEPVIVAYPAHGTLTRQPDGLYHYAPAADYNGEDEVRFAIVDGAGLQGNTATLRLTVTPVNDAPTAGDQVLAVAEDAELHGDLMAEARDIDSVPQAVTVVAGPAHGQLVLAPNGSFTYTPEADFHGDDSFTYQVNDGSLDSNVATVRITVTPVNDAPVAASAQLQLDEDGSLDVDFGAFGHDVDDAGLEAVIVAGPVHGTLVPEAGGSYRYTPAANYHGQDEVRFRLRDQAGALSDEVSLVLVVRPVNDAPETGDLSGSLLEDGYILLDLAAASSDLDGDALTITTGGIQHGTLVREADGRYRFTADADYFGTDAGFSYTVSDGSLSAMGQVTLTVEAVNDRPVATGETVSVDDVGTVTIALLANDTDVDNTPAQLAPVITAAPLHGTLTLNADGTVTYKPANRYHGPDSFQYVVSDGAAQSEPVTVQIEVILTNRDPSFVSAPPVSIALETAYASGDSVWQVAGSSGRTSVSYTLTQRKGSFKDEVGYFIVDDAQGRIGNLRPGDAGYAAAALAQDRATSIFAGSNAEGITHKKQQNAGQYIGFYLIQDSSLGYWRTKNTENSLSETPLAFFSFAGANPDGFDHLRASFDATGMLTMRWEDLTHGGDQDFNDMVINVAGLRQAKDGLIARLDYDSDATDPDGDTLTYSLAQAPQGASIDAASGRITWATAAVGTYSFSVLAADDKGGVATQAFTLTVREPNHAPVANADTASGLEDTTVQVNVLANDTDSDGDPLTAEIVTGPDHGTVATNTSGGFSYRPDLNWSGTDTFTYRVTDGTVASAPTTVKITIAPVNDAPVAPDLSYTLQQDGSVRIWLDDMVSDVDSECLTIAVTRPSRGTLTRNHDGSYTYRPAAGFVGLDGFGYTVSDGRVSASGTVRLDVQARPPVNGCDNSATITVPLGSGLQTVQWAAVKYVLLHKLSGGGSGSGPDVDWSQLADPAQLLAAVRSTQDWMVQLLGAGGVDSAIDPEQLAQLTGLRLDL